MWNYIATAILTVVAVTTFMVFVAPIASLSTLGSAAVGEIVVCS